MTRSQRATAGDTDVRPGHSGDDDLGDRRKRVLGRHHRVPLVLR